MCSDARNRVLTPKVHDPHAIGRVLQAAVSPGDGVFSRRQTRTSGTVATLVEDARRMVRAAVLVVCGCLALALALPAAGDPRHETPAAPRATAAARVQATLASLAAREAALDTASARATVRLHLARRLLVVARRNLARPPADPLRDPSRPSPLEVLLGAASVSDAVDRPSTASSEPPTRIARGSPRRSSLAATRRPRRGARSPPGRLAVAPRLRAVGGGRLPPRSRCAADNEIARRTGARRTASWPPARSPPGRPHRGSATAGRPGPPPSSSARTRCPASRRPGRRSATASWQSIPP